MSYDVQKAGMWKRISAFLFDFILLTIVAVGFATLLSWALKYDDYLDARNDCVAQYEEEYRVSFSITEEDFNTLAEEEKAKYNQAYGDAYKSAYEELLKDPVFAVADQMVFNLMLIILSFSILIAYLILEFAVPMFFKNGQTLGKKVFGIALMRIDGVKIDGPMLFTRSILGKYVVETMIPIIFLIMIFIGAVGGIVGLVAIGAIVITNIVMLIVTKDNCAIHDTISGTVAVDMASQLIFETPEALLEYKQKIHAEAAENAQYF